MTKKERIEMLERQLTQALAEIQTLRLRVSALEARPQQWLQPIWSAPYEVTCGAMGIGPAGAGVKQ